jgi:hypothetical protein
LIAGTSATLVNASASTSSIALNYANSKRLQF